MPQLSRFSIHHRALTAVFVASLSIPFALTHLAAIAITSVFGFDVEQDVFTQLASERSSFDLNAIWKLAPLIFGQFLFSLVAFFYPMLVFATTVSIYYREHVREPLLEALASSEETDQAVSAPQ